MDSTAVQVRRGNVSYYRVVEDQKVRITHQEYIDLSIAEAEAEYEKVRCEAIKNGSVSTGWVQRNFGFNWYGAAHLVARMEDEGVCEEYSTTNNGCRKVLTVVETS